MSHFDYTSLTASVDPADVTRLRDESKQAGVQPTEFSYNALIIGGIFGFLVLGGMFTLVWSGHPPLTGLFGLVLILFYVVSGGLALFILLIGLPNTIYHLRIQWQEFFRAHAFASANGLIYGTSADAWDREGAIFHMPEADKRRAGSFFRSTTRPEFEVVGHYHYSVEKQEVHWGYIAVDLGRPLPHLVLRSKRRAFRKRRFLTRYAQSPVVDLSQESDRRFTLYGEPEHAVEARMIFTDGLLQRLGGLGRGIDAETIGTRLFIYSPRQFGIPRVKAIRQLFEVVDVVLDDHG